MSLRLGPQQLVQGNREKVGRYLKNSVSEHWEAEMLSKTDFFLEEEKKIDLELVSQDPAAHLSPFPRGEKKKAEGNKRSQLQ